jgi:hypothetical protein
MYDGAGHGDGSMEKRIERRCKDHIDPRERQSVEWRDSLWGPIDGQAIEKTEKCCFRRILAGVHISREAGFHENYCGEHAQSAG